GRGIPSGTVGAARPAGAGDGALRAAGQRQDGAAAVLDRCGGPGRTGGVGAGGARRAGSAAVLAGGAGRAASDGPGVGTDTGADAGSGRLGDPGAAADRPRAAEGRALAGDRRPA